MALTLPQAKAKITAVIAALGNDAAAAAALTSTFDTQGKVYEAWCLSDVLLRLNHHEQLDAVLVGGAKLMLKSAPGPINRSYPYFELRRAGKRVAEVWTDIEVGTLSGGWYPGHYPGAVHELDIVVVEPGADSHPAPDELWLGAECKHTTYERRMLREVLGIRRELSLLTGATQTRFSAWPQQTVRAEPPSALIVYSIDPSVPSYQPAGDFFGIRFQHLPM